MSITEQAAPLVSVVVPTFNRPDYLRVALTSALAQSCGDFEIVVQDNASEADPQAVVAGFGDPRIRYFRNPANISQTANVVSACAKARGKYVAILGDDDVWHPDFLAALVAPLEADDTLALSFCDHEIVDATGRSDEAVGKTISRRFHRDRLREGAHRPFHKIALVHRSICLFSASVLRRADIPWQEVPLELGFGPLDHYLAYLAARGGKGCYYVARRLAQYRYHPGALGSSLKDPEKRLANARYSMFYWHLLQRDSHLRQYRRYFQLKLAFNALVIVANLLRSGHWRQALDYLKRYWADGLASPFFYLEYAMRLRRLRV